MFQNEPKRFRSVREMFAAVRNWSHVVEKRPKRFANVLNLTAKPLELFKAVLIIQNILGRDGTILKCPDIRKHRPQNVCDRPKVSELLFELTSHMYTWLSVDPLRMWLSSGLNVACTSATWHDQIGRAKRTEP